MNRYLLLKAIQLLREHTVLRSKRAFPGVYDFRQTTASPHSLGFDFSDSRFVHVGDQLFFEPILRQLRVHGFTVKVIPTVAMREYFVDAGYSVVSVPEMLAQDLRVAPIWMYDSIDRQERTRRFVYINSADHGMILPVTNHLTKYLMRLLNVEFDERAADCRPHKITGESALINGITGPILIYNDSVDSGGFRLSKMHYGKLLEIAEGKQREGYTLVRVGTNPERAQNPKGLPFPHIDLRGETSVLDLFRLLGSANTVGSISFDTVIAHLALLYEKPAWICMRIFSKSHAEHVRRFVWPSYLSEHPVSIHYL